MGADGAIVNGMRNNYSVSRRAGLVAADEDVRALLETSSRGGAAPRFYHLRESRARRASRRLANSKRSGFATANCWAGR